MLVSYLTPNSSPEAPNSFPGCLKEKSKSRFLLKHAHSKDIDLIVFLPRGLRDHTSMSIVLVFIDLYKISTMGLVKKS